MTEIVIQAVSALIIDPANRVLLIKRRNDPYRGYWSLPGGRVQTKESLFEATAREVYEETGLNAEVIKLLGKQNISKLDHRAFEISIYLAQVIVGSLQAGSDALEARWVNLAELDSLTLTPNLAAFLRKNLPEIATGLINHAPE